MVRVLTTLIALLLLITPAYAQTAHVPENHSTVHIVFAASTMKPRVADGTTANAIIKNMILPLESIRPVAIHIDDQFVGNALFGHEKVSPIFVLPKGPHKFTFACDGYKTAKTELHVLGTGSTQYLIVKLPLDDSGLDSKPTPGNRPVQQHEELNKQPGIIKRPPTVSHPIVAHLL
ncbi:hypothetical protein [Rhodopirellula sp. SWK7]|uniref:hypothetical protein n=1 Tax=Rhodopirellula sp. SWK7 TaxID=595460 RepID=UPI0002BED603|nr:hypothetical protein [Rhodopirellula sp. SWK7]EMI47413.1 signal peptide protein [Rhodopirellula sp. SWK7]